jgi:hypothetical protein
MAFQLIALSSIQPALTCVFFYCSREMQTLERGFESLSQFLRG